jgi:hypothetical protein
MKKIAVLFTFLFLANLALAQFGIKAGYLWQDAKDWQAVYDIGNENVLENNYTVGLDYWFRLKNYRIEFLPELNYTPSSKNFEIREGITNTAKVNLYSFFLNTNFYLLDFAGDCNCPTFSKQGQFFKKGFFIQLSPGVTYFQQAVSRTADRFSGNAFAFNLGAGAGIDIGITDVVTLTPLAGVRYYPKVTWESLPEVGDPVTVGLKSTESPITQFFAGARLGFRFDYPSRGRRR